MKKLFVFLCLIATINVYGQSKRAFKKMTCDHRKEYKAKFLSNERSPIKSKKELKHLKFYKPNPAYKVVCDFELLENGKIFEMATFNGETQSYKKYGKLTFEMDGKKHSLFIYQNMNLINVPGYKDYLFLPFKDKTNSITTYGGGRYMDLKIDDIDKNVYILDFNKSYNPWCAYSGGYSCPVPPKENHLGLRIIAGEKSYGKSKK